MVRSIRLALMVVCALSALAACLAGGALFAAWIIEISDIGFWHLVLGTIVIATPTLGILYLSAQYLVLSENPAAVIPITIYVGAVLETSVHLISTHHHWPLWVAILLGIIISLISVVNVLRPGSSGAREALGWGGRMH